MSTLLVVDPLAGTWGATAGPNMSHYGVPAAEVLCAIKAVDKGFYAALRGALSQD